MNKLEKSIRINSKVGNWNFEAKKTVDRIMAFFTVASPKTMEELMDGWLVGLD